MTKNRLKNDKTSMRMGILLLSMGLFFPVFMKSSWFGIVFKIREAINVGDSGHLILAAANTSFLYAVQSTLIFLGAMAIIDKLEINRLFREMEMRIISVLIITFLYWADSLVYDLPWEPVSTIIALIITLFIFDKILEETGNFLHVSAVSIQVFFAFQWLNIMPLFSAYRFGQSDIPNSIKIVGLYLQATSVLNFTGFAFFLPFITSAFITSALFISFSRNMHVVRENYEKENEIRDMKAKALENRIYKEVKSLVHDLKTPLVTIRGLNSLIAVSKEQTKLVEYSERIENSITRMSEMISSFLYEASRQKLKTLELISYIRAQLPLEDDSIKFDLQISKDLPDIYVNKIRMARAIINILENAINAPYHFIYKLIVFEVKPAPKGIYIVVKDNGNGIKKEDFPHIWEVGFSTNNTSGLGLPFAKQIIEDNEGEIKLSSEPDVGTEVTIFLPAASNYFDDLY